MMPDAIAELLPLVPHLLPFDAARCLAVLQARQARGEKVFRTAAYKPPTPPTKGASTAEFLIMEVLAPMWQQREALRPQHESLAAYSARLEQCYRIGPFLAAQIIADLKPVALKVRQTTQHMPALALAANAGLIACAAGRSKRRGPQHIGIASC